MDAKPVRRALHVPPDENMNPQQKQASHQRHKSAGTALGANGLKGGAKRAVFGDLSNTARVVKNTQDDFTAIGKGNGPENIQSMPQDKASGLNLPAHRPASTAAKNLLGQNSNTQTTAAGISTAQSQPLANQSQPVKPRAIPKRTTAIYKDENAAPSDRISQPETSKAGPVDSAPLPPAHQGLGPRQHKSQPSLKIDQPILRRTQSRHTANSASKPLQGAVPASAQKPVTEQVQEEEGQQSVDLPKCRNPLEEVPAELESVETDVIVPHESSEREERELPTLPLVSEAEEYWDEEDEEAYEEQGYTTAHSGRYRGDNTTGGATTVMIPRASSSVEQELAAAKEYVDRTRTREDIDDDAWDTSMVAEYGDEIFTYMRDLETQLSPNPHYMDNQAEIQWSMRSVLMDWLVQVHHRFSLLPETLFLCANYVDRFLSVKVVSLGKLQLVGATAIFVAAKYEEINCPSVNEIVYMVDDGYSADEVLKAERYMLGMLNFELGWPGPMSFLRRISKADDYDLETRTVAKYFLEVTIMDERFVGSPPSFLAAGAHCISRMMLNKGDWSLAHAHYSGYTWTQLRPLVALILECCENAEKHHAAIFEKYSDRRYKRASQFVKTSIQNNFKLPPAKATIAAPLPPKVADSEANDSENCPPYDTSYPRETCNNLVAVRG